MEWNEQHGILAWKEFDPEDLIENMQRLIVVLIFKLIAHGEMIEQMKSGNCNWIKFGVN